MVLNSFNFSRMVSLVVSAVNNRWRTAQSSSAWLPPCPLKGRFGCAASPMRTVLPYAKLLIGFRLRSLHVLIVSAFLIRVVSPEIRFKKIEAYLKSFSNEG